MRSNISKALPRMSKLNLGSPIGTETSLPSKSILYIPSQCTLICRIQNPLLGLSRETLYNISDSFCAEHGFNDKIDLFRRAAVLAQNPNDFESLTELTDEDKFWVRREHTRMSYVSFQAWHLMDR